MRGALLEEPRCLSAAIAVRGVGQAGSQINDPVVVKRKNVKVSEVRRGVGQGQTVADL